MGSGQGQEYEQKYKTNEIPSTGAAAELVSPETDAVYKAVTAQLKGIDITQTFYQLSYPAPSVDVLASGLTKPSSLIGAGQVIGADWDRLVNTNMVNYIAGELQGESELSAYLTQIYNDCHAAGQQPMVVLAGYSQGAMVVHNVLNVIAASKQTNLSSMIKGAVLIADPERMPDSDVLNFGTAAWGDYGLCHAADLYLSGVASVAGTAQPSCVSPDKTTDVASEFASVAYQVCDTGDIVCDTSHLFDLNSLGGIPTSESQLKEEWDTFLEKVKLGESTHSNSYAGSAVTTAGRRVARSLILDGLGSQQSPLPSTSTPSGNGSWTATEAPLPANAGSGYLYFDSLSAVSCPSASYCVAVGGYTDTSKDNEGVLLTWSGKAWTAAQAPLPANALPDETSDPGNYVSGVSCVSASYCVAVGSYVTTDDTLEGLLLTWSGGAWTATEAPLPPNAISQPSVSLPAISCSSTTSCVAVGDYEDTSGDFDGLLLTWSGGAWTATEAPLPANGRADSSVIGVSCPSASSCVAVGNYHETTYGELEGLLLSWSGGAWTATEAPLPPNAADDSSPDYTSQSATVSGVSCPSISYCTADGTYVDKSEGSDGVLLTWSGGAWSASQAPLPANGGGYTGSPYYFGMSCPSTSYCVATGTYDSNASAAEGALLTWSGGAWTAAEAPLPANATSTPGLSGVSCATASYCVAVGAYSDSSENEDSLLLTWSG